MAESIEDRGAKEPAGAAPALPRLMTSNLDKLREYRRLGLAADLGGPGPDMPEVSAPWMEVALRKAEMAGPGCLVEDASLDVEGRDVGVDARWLMAQIGSMAGRRAVFRVALAFNDGVEVRAHVGSVEGALGEASSSARGGFGFDPYFKPDGAGGLTLSELDAAGRKDEFSARARAARAYAGGEVAGRRPLGAFEPWTGAWQGGEGPGPARSQESGRRASKPD